MAIRRRKPGRRSERRSEPDPRRDERETAEKDTGFVGDNLGDASARTRPGPSSFVGDDIGDDHITKPIDKSTPFRAPKDTDPSDRFVGDNLGDDRVTGDRPSRFVGNDIGDDAKGDPGDPQPYVKYDGVDGEAATASKTGFVGDDIGDDGIAGNATDAALRGAKDAQSRLGETIDDPGMDGLDEVPGAGDAVDIVTTAAGTTLGVATAGADLSGPLAAVQKAAEDLEGSKDEATADAVTGLAAAGASAGAAAADMVEDATEALGGGSADPLDTMYDVMRESTEQGREDAKDSYDESREAIEAISDTQVHFIEGTMDQAGAGSDMLDDATEALGGGSADPLDTMYDVMRESTEQGREDAKDSWDESRTGEAVEAGVEAAQDFAENAPNPARPAVEAIEAIYDTTTFLVENAEEVGEFTAAKTGEAVEEGAKAAETTADWMDQAGESGSDMLDDATEALARGADTVADGVGDVGDAAEDLLDKGAGVSAEAGATAQAGVGIGDVSVSGGGAGSGEVEAGVSGDGVDVAFGGGAGAHADAGPASGGISVSVDVEAGMGASGPSVGVGVGVDADVDFGTGSSTVDNLDIEAEQAEMAQDMAEDLIDDAADVAEDAIDAGSDALDDGEDWVEDTFGLDLDGSEEDDDDDDDDGGIVDTVTGWFTGG